VATGGLNFDPEKDYYGILGVNKDVDQKEIRKVYRKLAQKWHPDANPGDKAAEEKFKEISAAYDVVGDPDKRKEYDEMRSLFGSGARYGGNAQGGFRFNDISDIFGDLLGRGGRRQPTTGPRRGQDLEAEIHLSFADAVRGITTAVHLQSESACPDCLGSGAAPGTSPKPCPECGGRGTTSSDQGFFSFSRTCTRCRGTGQIVDEPCPRCGGSGVTTQPRRITVRIPPGVSDGGRIRLKGKGVPGSQGGPPGDLFLTVHVEPDKVFGRKGEDLTLTVPVTFAEAALGAEIEVPTITGDTVRFKVPPGTSSGKTFRLKGKGGPKPRGGGADLLVTVEVVVPARLEKEEKEALQRFAAVHHENPRAQLWG
jgi:molecular chaperone DnaJ